MKFILKSAAILALLLIGFTGCKKSYTCTCKLDGVIVEQLPYTNMTKSVAVSSCAADEVLIQQDNNNPSIGCSID